MSLMRHAYARSSGTPGRACMASLDEYALMIRLIIPGEEVEGPIEDPIRAGSASQAHIGILMDEARPAREGEREGGGGGGRWWWEERRSRTEARVARAT